MTPKEDILLYIDDEEPNLLLFEIAFIEHYKIITTTSTTEAREFLKNYEIKVVIADLRMPSENGLDFIKSVSQIYPDISYILLTAYIDIETSLNAINLGVLYRYILKPWDNFEMNITLRNAVKAFDLKKENRILFEEVENKNERLNETINQLKESQQQLFSIFSNSSDSIIIVDCNAKILLANPFFYKLLELSRDKEASFEDFMDSKNLKVLRERVFSKAFETNPVFEYEVFTSSGQKKYIETNTTEIDFQGRKALLSIIRDVTERKLMEQKILNAVVQAEEKERSRIAKDMHDGVGPILATLKMCIEWLANDRPDNKEEILNLSLSSINDAVLSLKSISNNLSPHILEQFGLVTAIQSQIEKNKLVSSINYNLSIDFEGRLKPEIEVVLYRIIKECMNNTLKYSKASEANIVIEKGLEKLIIQYKDNGVGFDVEKTIIENYGMGLYNMKNRIKSVGGNIVFYSEPSKGVFFTIEIPYS